MKHFQRLLSLRFLKKASLWTLILLVVYSVTGFFITPPVLKSFLTRKLSEAYHREVTIEKIKVNPFILSVDIQNFLMKERDSSKPFATFGKLSLNIQSISLVKRGLVLKELRLDMPYLNVVRNEDGSFNISDIIEKRRAREQPLYKTVRFSINNIQIRNGSIDFWDGPRHTQHKVGEITLTIPFISNLPYYVNTYVQPLFEAKVNGRMVAFRGKTKPFKDSLETVLDLNVNNLDIPRYLVYAPFKMDFAVVSGLFDMKGILSYIQYKDRKPSLTVEGNVYLKEIGIDINDIPALRFPLFGVSIATSDIMSRNIHFSNILLQSPELLVSRDRGGRVNLSALLPPKDQEVPSSRKEEQETPFFIEADEIAVRDGKASFSDEPGGSAFKTTLEAIDLKVEQFTNVSDKRSAVAFIFKTESDETVSAHGDFSLDPFRTEGTVEVKNALLKKYMPYYRERILFSVEDGVLNLSTRLGATKGERDFSITLSDLEASLKSLRLRKDSEDFLSIPTVGIKGTSVDLAKRELSIGEFSTEKGKMTLRRQTDGRFNAGLLLPPPEHAEIGGKAIGSEKEAPWAVTVKHIDIQGYTIKAEDHVTSEPVMMVADQMKLKAEAVSTKKENKGRMSLSCKLNQTGSVSTEGNFSINPFSADLKINMKGIEIIPFQPYFADLVKIVIGDGALSANGTISFSRIEKESIKASYKGEASVTQFHSLDKEMFDDFLKWRSLHLSKVDVGYNPLNANVGEVAITDFYSRLIVHEDGSLNVQGIMEPYEKGPVKSSPESPREGQVGARNKGTFNQVKIEKVTLQGGTINFSDHYIKPHFSANFLDIGGRVSGLSSAQDQLADVDLRGKIDNYAPVEITGRINPLRKDLYVDLKLGVKNIDLSPVTPYSDKYVGYTIEKGKLSMSLQYLIVDRNLDAQHSVFLEQLTLGDKVESPDATKLPVKLAIALLKDRKGEISLDLPVSGSIDDPKFSVGKIILKILVNILVKAATAPFALLGAIFGGGEELSYLEFDYGLATIDAQGQKKLETLSKTLSERPSLKIEIEGHADMEKDREGLLQYLFLRKIKTQKQKEIVEKSAFLKMVAGGVCQVSQDGIQGGKVPKAKECHRYGKGSPYY